MLVSVSLAAAFPDTAEEARSYVGTFLEAAEWQPAQTILVAGAIKPGIYDWFQQSALLEGDLAAHLDEDLSGTKEFTDWEDSETEGNGVCRYLTAGQDNPAVSPDFFQLLSRHIAGHRSRDWCQLAVAR